MTSPTHQKVSGTKISIIPPAGFVEASDFSGFQQDASGSSIMVVSVPGAFSEVESGISPENLLEKGVEVSRIEQLEISGLPAVLATGKQCARGSLFGKYVLVFGNETECTVINGLYPDGLDILGAEVKAAMLSAQYHEDDNADDWANIHFSIDVSPTRLKVAQIISGFLICTADGCTPPSSDDKTIFLVARSFGELQLTGRKLLALNRLKLHYALEVEKIEYTRKITIDDISGYEIIALARNTEDDFVYLYQIMLFTDHHYYLILGVIAQNDKPRVREMKMAAQTFRRK
jgi:hypothetical protein